MKNLFLVSFLALFLISCKTQKTGNTTSVVDSNAPIVATEFYKTINKKSDFTQVKISSAINVETGQFIPALDGTIYIENEKKVWINLSALFFNVSRGLATPSGIQAYEKWNKTYIDSDFGYINRLLNVNFVDFLSLQNLLIGKNFIPIKEEDFLLKKNAQGFTLHSIKNQKISTEGKTKEYKISMDFSPEFDLQHVVLQDALTAENLEVFYSNWIFIEKNKFPKNVKIIIKEKKTSQILIENTKFEFSKMETPFSIPNNYTKTEIK